MLQLITPKYHIVRKGQTLTDLAAAYCLPESLLVKENELTEELFEGQILRIPNVRGNLYVVKAGEGKTLLCGSAENFYRRNGTHTLYPTQRVLL